jgi:hypothetical protein
MQRKPHAPWTTATLLAAVASLAAPVAFGDDDYQFIIAGDPEAAATVNSSYDESPTTALDGVNRTVAESATTYLYTDKVAGTMLIIR